MCHIRDKIKKANASLKIQQISFSPIFSSLLVCSYLYAFFFFFFKFSTIDSVLLDFCQLEKQDSQPRSCLPQIGLQASLWNLL